MNENEAIPLRRQPWNNGKLIGAKPPLRVWQCVDAGARARLPQSP